MSDWDKEFEALRKMQDAYERSLMLERSGMAKRFEAIWNRFSLKHPEAEDVRCIMGSLMETHPTLQAMPDDRKKLEAAFRMAMSTMVTMEDTSAMLDKAIRKTKKRKP